MNIKKLAGLTLTTLALNLIMIADINAASTSVKCEVRTNRSKASVDGASLANGLYRASLKSGTSAAIFSKLPLQRPVAGEVEFDFDSNPADVRAGATAIPAAYIKSRRAVGSLYLKTTTGLRLVGSVAAICK